MGSVEPFSFLLRPSVRPSLPPSLLPSPPPSLPPPFSPHPPPPSLCPSLSPPLQNGGCDDFLYEGKFHPSWVIFAGINLITWGFAFFACAVYLGERRGAPATSSYMKYATYSWVSYWMIYNFGIFTLILVLEKGARNDLVSVKQR